MSDQMNVSFDMNKFLEAYTKEDFMKKVFVDFLKTNSSVISDAIGTYVVMDLIKSGQMEAIAKATADAVTKQLAELDTNSYNSPIRKGVTEIIVGCVAKNSNLINNKVSKVINDDFNQERIIQQVNNVINTRIINGLKYNLEED